MQCQSYRGATMHVELSSNRIALSMGSNVIVFCSFWGD